MHFDYSLTQHTVHECRSLYQLSPLIGDGLGGVSGGSSSGVWVGLAHLGGQLLYVNTG